MLSSLAKPGDALPPRPTLRAGRAIPDPVLVLEMRIGRLVWPGPEDATALTRTPEWAKPLVEAALSA